MVGVWVLRDEKSGFGEKFKNVNCYGKIEIIDNAYIGTECVK